MCKSFICDQQERENRLYFKTILTSVGDVAFALIHFLESCAAIPLSKLVFALQSTNSLNTGGL